MEGCAGLQRPRVSREHARGTLPNQRCSDVLELLRKEHLMRNTRTALWAAMFVAGAIGFAGIATAQSNNPPGAGAGVSGSVDKSGVHVSGDVNPPGTDATAQPLALPKGFSQKDLNETTDIKKTLSGLTEDAVTKDHFDSLIGYLAKPD